MTVRRRLRATACLAWLALSAGGCFDDVHLGAHACDSCRDCETCIDVLAGIAVCRPEPAVGEQCGQDGNVHRVNSCGESEELRIACENGSCEATSATTAACTCRNRWEDVGCSFCPDHWDLAQDCGACRGGWTGEQCDTCGEGWDEAAGCTTCASGFALEGSTCVDVDECLDDPCGPVGTCTNRAGSYRCRCDPGYEASGGTCVDADECAADNGGCDALTSCTNVVGSRLCSACPSGYTGDGLSGCVDVDECAVNDGGCAALTSCINEPGTWHCGPCPDGYDGDAQIGCTDIDECAAGTDPCGDHGQCMNEPGAYGCNCDGGYEEVDGVCEDIDECATDNGSCDPLTSCTNTTGARTCGACPGGYTGDGESGCVDVDECDVPSDPCGVNGTCVNQTGSYSCDCDPGYEEAAGLCVDADECEEVPGLCGANATCVNTLGSYDCDCDGAYTYAAWGSSEPVETDDNGDALTPELVVDATGAVLAVWSQSDGTYHDILSNRYAVPGGWGTPTTLEAIDAGDALDPRVAQDPSGNALVAWHQFGGTFFDVWANRYTVGVGWGGATLLDAEDAEDAAFPDVGMDDAGNGLVLWSIDDALTDVVWARWHVAGVGWDDAESISSVGLSAGTPALAVNGSGSALAAWRHGYPARNIHANDYASGAWGTTDVIGDAAEVGARDVKLGMDAAGNGIAVWESDVAPGDVWTNRYTVGLGWGVAERLETRLGVAERPDVAMTSNGDAMVAWSQSDGVRRDVWARRYAAGVGWGPLELVECDDAGDAHLRDLATDGAGNAIALWVVEEAMAARLVANLYTPSNGWAEPQTLATADPGALGEARVAMYGTAKAVAVWSETPGGGVANIRSSRLD